MYGNLSQIEMLLAGLITLFFIFISYKIGFSVATKKCKGEKVQSDKEAHSSNKSLKRILEEEKNQVVLENDEYKRTNMLLKGRIEEYRKKLSGMGMLSFSGNKRRSDILYSLLLENEALEQLITEQGEKMDGERKDFVMHRMRDIRKRQRLLAEIFNDDTIKNYVNDVLSDEKKIEDAAYKIENRQTADPLKEKDEIRAISK